MQIADTGNWAQFSPTQQFLILTFSGEMGQSSSLDLQKLSFLCLCSTARDGDRGQTNKTDIYASSQLKIHTCAILTRPHIRGTKNCLERPKYE